MVANQKRSKLDISGIKLSSVGTLCSKQITLPTQDLFGISLSIGTIGSVRQTMDRWLRPLPEIALPSSTIRDYGTFKESLRAPIHRWFKYPAGYSYRLVEEKLKEYNLKSGASVLDPFVGSGTTSLECKRQGIRSVGIEAHPFVAWVARTNLEWAVV